MYTPIHSNTHTPLNSLKLARKHTHAWTHRDRHGTAASHAAFVADDDEIEHRGSSEDKARLHTKIEDDWEALMEMFAVKGLHTGV